MTDTPRANPESSTPEPADAGGRAGQRRPDEGRNPPPGKAGGAPASGAEGAAGAGGPDGFGTGD